MFDGESKQRVVKAGGRKRDLSRNHLIEDSRRQREERVLEKKRIAAAVVIQKHVRRYLSQQGVMRDFKASLDQQLKTITKITSIMPDFCVPSETVLLLIRYSVHSNTRRINPESWNTILAILVKSLRSIKPSLNLSSLLSNGATLSLFQVSFAAFCREMFSSLAENESVPQYFLDFYSSIFLTIGERNNGSFEMRDTMIGVLRMLGDLPFKILQLILEKPQLKEAFELISQICEVLLNHGDNLSEESRSIVGDTILGYSSATSAKSYNQVCFLLNSSFIFLRYHGNTLFNLFSREKLSGVKVIWFLLVRDPCRCW
jgi:hypothetical protein